MWRQRRYHRRFPQNPDKALTRDAAKVMSHVLTVVISIPEALRCQGPPSEVTDAVIEGDDVPPPRDAALPLLILGLHLMIQAPQLIGRPEVPNPCWGLGSPPLWTKPVTTTAEESEKGTLATRVWGASLGPSRCRS
jgi:hypothetical protein